MRRLYWLIMSLINNECRLEYKLLGEGEYLAKHGISNDVDDSIKTLQGEPLVKLNKHLHI